MINVFGDSNIYKVCYINISYYGRRNNQKNM